MMVTRCALLSLVLCFILTGCDDKATTDKDTLGEVTDISDVSTDLGPDTATPVPNCGSERCDEGQTCCGRTCVDVSSESAHCGGCGQSCDAAASCEDGGCVCGGVACGEDDACCDIAGAPACTAIEENPQHCGACGNACGDNQICQGGLCLCENGDGVYEQCREGESCCPGLGCRALGSDANSCGTCGLVCNPGELCDKGVCACGDTRGSSSPACGDGEACCGETPSCVASDDPQCTCGTGTCLAGELCCPTRVDGVETDRCVDVSGDLEQCGACGVVCGASQVCIGGQCVCDGGFGDCDADLANGCEAKLATDVAHCGACGVACAPGEVCDGLGRCATTCQPGATQCSDTCVWLDRTPDECGGCGLTCGPGEVCSAGLCATSCQLGLVNCRGACINLDTDRFNCGGCGLACAAGQVCQSGRCTLSCEAGLTNCDGTCVDTLTDERNCSACGFACAKGFECSDGQCTLTCQAGLTTCDGVCVDTDTSRSHCGVCGNVCPQGNVCDGGGNCALTCQEGLTQCLGVCVDLDDSAVHCGACGNACAPGEACQDGACRIVCPGELVSCSNTCIDVQNDRRHCGGCGQSCPQGQQCENGACALVCPPSQEACGGQCVTLNTDPAHCGACDNACGAGEVCVQGTCSGSCPLTQCGNVCVDLNQSPEHCGACDNACSYANGTGACIGGSCILALCDAGWDDCDGDPSNGCELDVTTDPNNCGGCGAVCASLPNTTGESCVDSACAIQGCVTGTEDCDGDPTNGCETQLLNDPENCNACGNSCALPNVINTCFEGTCTPGGCVGGYGDCNIDRTTDGCEVDLTTSATDCGACGNVCAVGVSCTAGECLCGGVEACSLTGAHHTDASCSGSECTLTCEAGYSDCDGDASNSCEAHLATDSKNCGTCGTDCTLSGEQCVNGACEQVFTTCAELRSTGVLTSGTYNIDLDQTANPVPVYCDMQLGGGAGWNLISVVRNDVNSLIVGPGYCSTLDVNIACKGHMPPQRVTPVTEIMIVDLDANLWLVYNNFSADATSALRYFTLERSLTLLTGCDGTADHVCNNTTIDPFLRIHRSSGLEFDVTPPLHQWWRGGGWWVGNDSTVAGRLHTTSYISDNNLIYELPVGSSTTNLVSTGHQAIFWR